MQCFNKLMMLVWWVISALAVNVACDFGLHSAALGFFREHVWKVAAP